MTENEIKPKLSLRAYAQVFVVLFLIAIECVFGYLLYFTNEPFDDMAHVVFYFVLASIFILFAVEITQKFTFFIINERGLRIRSLGSFYVKREIDWNSFDGYASTNVSSKIKAYEVLSLKKGNKTILKISEFHFSNFKEIKEFIDKYVDFMGEEEYNLLEEIKSSFRI